MEKTSTRTTEPVTDSNVALTTLSDDCVQISDGDLKRSAAVAALTDSSDRKRNGDFCVDANRHVRVTSTNVHIELISDEEETFFDV